MPPDHSPETLFHVAYILRNYGKYDRTELIFPNQPATIELLAVS